MELLRLYAMSFIGLPYRWGGDDTIDGMDCSGLVQEILASVGMDPPGDQTAQGLFDHFSNNGTWKEQSVGALAFYGKDAKSITHVAFMISNDRIIEAGGGGSKTRTREDAAAQNAFVRVRPLKHRSDLVAVIRPLYVLRGL